MKSVGDSIVWPADYTPKIHHGGRYKYGPDQWAAPFVMAYMAVHLHETKGTLTLDGRKFSLLPGDVTIMPTGSAFTHRAPRGGEHHCIHFYAARKKGPSVAVPLHLRLGAAAFVVHERLLHIITMLRLAGPSEVGQLASRVAAIALQELLLWLALQRSEKRAQSPNWRTQKRLLELTQKIDAGLASVLSVPALAAEIGLSQDYLASLFRKHYGVTIPNYILRRRIDTARHLLLNTRDSIGAVAANVGLPNAQYFNKQFRRFVGKSPTDFRI